MEQKRLATITVAAGYALTIIFGLLISWGSIRLIPNRVWRLVFAAGCAIVAFGLRGVLRTTHTHTTRVRRLSSETKLYKEPDSRSSVVSILAVGSDTNGIEAGKKEVNDLGLEWQSLCLPDGQKGFALGELHSYSVLKAELVSEALLYKAPDKTSRLIALLAAGCELEIREDDVPVHSFWQGVLSLFEWLFHNMSGFRKTRMAEDFLWVTASLPNEQNGYITRDTKLKWK